METIRHYQRNIKDNSKANFTISFVDDLSDITYEIIGDNPKIIAMELNDMLLDVMDDKLEAYIIEHPSINGTHIIIKDCIDGYMAIWERYCLDLMFDYDSFIMSILRIYGSDAIYVDDGYSISLCNILHVDDGAGGSDHILESIAIDRSRHAKLFVSLNNKKI